MNSPANLDVLIMNAKQMNEEALAELYDSYLPRVFRYVYYQVNDRTLAEDLTSETFLKMLTAISDFREDGKSFYPWLLRVAKNTILDYLRSKSRQPQVLQDDEIEEYLGGNGHDLEHAVFAALDAEEVKKAISQLTEEQQQVLILKFTMGLSNAEVAKVLEKTEGSIKSLQVRALSSLKRVLEKESWMGDRIEPTVGSSEKEAVRKA